MRYMGAAVGAVASAGLLYGSAKLCGVDSFFPPGSEKDPFLIYPLTLAYYGLFVAAGAAIGNTRQNVRDILKNHHGHQEE